MITVLKNNNNAYSKIPTASDDDFYSTDDDSEDSQSDTKYEPECIIIIRAVTRKANDPTSHV